MKSILVILATILATVSYGQKIERTIEPYSSLIVSRGVDVRLIKSDALTATISLNGVDPEDLIIYNKGKELYIKVATKTLWQEMEDNHWWVRIELPYTEIHNIEVMTGAKVSSETVFNGTDLDVQVSMGGELDLDINVDELIIDSSMGGLVEFTGYANFVDITTSMGSEVDLSDLEGKDVTVKSSMGSDVKVKATQAFYGKASMGGIIRLYGNPEKLHESTSMGGEISRGN